MPDREVHLEGIGEAQGLGRPLHHRERGAGRDQRGPGGPWQQPRERQRPRRVPGKQHRPEQHQQHERPADGRDHRFHGLTGHASPGNVARQSHERDEQHRSERHSCQPSQGAEAEPPENLPDQAGGSEPALVARELEHPEGGVLGLQEAERQAEAEDDREPGVARERAGTLRLWCPGDHPHDDEHEGKGHRGLDERADRQHRDGSERAVVHEQQHPCR